MSAQARPRAKMHGRLIEIKVSDKVSRAAAPVVRSVVREREITT